MNNFQKNLAKDAKGVLAQRIDILAEQTAAAQQKLLNNLLDKRRQLNLRLLNLIDLSPANTYDLKPGGDNYNPDKWVAEKQEIEIQLLNLQVEIDAAQGTIDEYFTELPDNVVSIGGPVVKKRVRKSGKTA